VDLPRFDGRKTSYEPFSFFDYDALPDKVKLANNGHTVKLSFDFKQKGKIPKVSIAKVHVNKEPFRPRCLAAACLPRTRSRNCISTGETRTPSAPSTPSPM